MVHLILFLTPLGCGSGSKDNDLDKGDFDSVTDDGSNTSNAVLDIGALVYGDLVFTEVMVDPLGGGQWVEVLNRRDESIDLVGLVVHGETVADSLVVGSQQWFVFGDGGASDIDALKQGSAMEITAGGLVIDALTIDPSFGLVSGYSLSLDPGLANADDNNNAEAWCLAVDEMGGGDYGTPAASNPACPVDADKDGYLNDVDCDDTDPSIHPDAIEEFYDGVDSDCDGASDYDADGDGHDSNDYDGPDCDDTDETIYPKATDIKDDGIDQNCDGFDETTVSTIADLVEGDLVVAEVMKNPGSVGDANGEWFELVYTGDYEVDLAGLVVHDGGGETFTVGKTLRVTPGNLLVFGINADVKTNGGVILDYEYSGFSLSDSSDAIILESDIEIERLAYDSDFPNASGVAMALNPDSILASANDDPRGWCEANSVYGTASLVGTPGANNDGCVALNLNDIQEGELVISEIMKDPDAVSDGDGEWFEIWNYNRFEVNIDGLDVTDDDGDWFRVVGTVVIEPRQFVVLSPNDDATENGGVTVDYEWSDLDTFQLDNGSDEIVLSFGGDVIDEVAWDNGVTFPDPVGASMAVMRGHLDADDNDDGSVWCISPNAFGDGDYGSPRSTNDCK